MKYLEKPTLTGVSPRCVCRCLVLFLMLLYPLSAAATEKARLQLKWGHQFQFAGYYAAHAQGYYQAAGLDVEILPSQPGEDPVQQVLQGKAEFGVGATDLLLLREQGASVVALAVIFQHSPLALMTLKHSGIENIHDLAGCKIMIEPGSSELYAYLRKEGISSDKFTLLPHGFHTKDLLAGNVDAMSVYVTDQPFELINARQEYLLYSPRAVGIDFYGDNLFTTESQIKLKPKMVKAFRGASLKGWEYAMEHPEELVQLIYSHYSQRHSIEHLRFEVRQMVPLLQWPLVELGHMNSGRWRHIAEVYAELGDMAPGFNFKGFLYDLNPPPPDLRWLYGFMGLVTLVLVVVSGVTVYIHRINAQLRQKNAELKQAEGALQESESRLRTIFDVSQAGIILVDPRGIITFANRGMAKMFGCTHQELIGSSYPEHVHPDQRNIGDQRMRQLIAGEIDSVAYERHYICSDGTDFFGFLSGRRHEDKQGKFISLVGIIADITEQKTLEDKLRQTQKMEAIGNLAGGIAHDFNNILFPIVGMSELLLEDLSPGSLEYDKVKVILKAGIRGGDLTKQILAFSRQSEHKTMPVRMQQILKEVLKLSRATIPSNIEIHSNIQSDCGMVMADPTQVHQIAMNLITNAYHAVEASGGCITLELNESVLTGYGWLGTSLEPGKYAVMTVTDTGCGIDPAALEKIFEPFFTTKEQGKGTGLGLSVVHGIVKEHNGDISVSSKPGKGTAFTVYLPVLKTATEPVSPEKVIIYETGTERILLADDEEPIVRLEQMMLEKLGYHVTARTSSPDALAVFKTNPSKFDLVISDKNMPNMTGEQLARELISIKPDIPVIICTGFSDENDEQRAKAMGIKGFLMKPVVKSDMAKMVRKVLDEAKG